MNKDKAGELLGKFKDDFGYHEDIERGLYWIEFFLDRIYAEGFEICPREFVSNEVDK